MDIIKVIIADDHIIFRKGLSTILNEIGNVKVVGEAANGLELLELLRKTPADVILMDIKMPQMDGIEATRNVIAHYPDIRVIALTMHEEISYFNKMIEVGATGFLLKKTTQDELEKAIIAVACDEPYFSEEFMSNVQMNPLIHQRKQPDIQLTPREQEVLELICKGESNPEISKRLGLSQRTIDGHRARLFEKTGAKNAPHLVMYAIKNGLIKT
ncbi:MAG: response regulator transcription factor [Bacteroidales bacterium]|nr:response regulator transcription factor [Bacteroidales bacterium]